MSLLFRIDILPSDSHGQSDCHYCLSVLQTELRVLCKLFLIPMVLKFKLHTITHKNTV